MGVDTGKRWHRAAAYDAAGARWLVEVSFPVSRAGFTGSLHSSAASRLQGARWWSGWRPRATTTSPWRSTSPPPPPVVRYGARGAGGVAESAAEEGRRMRDEGEDDAEFAVTVARQEERRRQGALLVLQECCQRAGAAVEELRRTERDQLERGFEGAVGEGVFGARRKLARALRALEDAAFDPLVLSAAELAEAEGGELGESPFP
jgi:hypothetical protein